MQIQINELKSKYTNLKGGIYYKRSKESVYTFTDMDLFFVTDEEGKRLYTTKKKDEFLKHLGKLNDFPLADQTIPYFIEVQDGKVISITEEFMYII